ncbi:MAG: DUF1302 family protein [bacterium]
MARCGRATQHGVLWSVLGALMLVVGVAPPAGATLKYGPIELSGSVDSQTLIRTSQIDNWQFIQNRNTALARLDYDWLQNGKLVDRFDTPFLKRSKLYLLYRGVYDSFWGAAPGGLQKGVTGYDDKVGGPIIGNKIGQTQPNTTSVCTVPPCPVPGVYSSLTSSARNAHAFENTLREAYVDFALADAPLSFRLGRQQVIWGESDQFRLMDIINPLDTTWHLQQEDWDKIRIPLWLGKMIWDIGDVGPFANSFAELVFNPGDFQPGNKVDFLPAPWAIPVPNPTRAGQIQLASPNQPILLTPVFNLQGTSYRQGNFSRSIAEAGEVGLRFHSVSDIPLINLQGLEYTFNYYYGRGRGIGAVAGAPFGLDIQKVTVPDTFIPANAFKQADGTPARFSNSVVFPADVQAEFVFPYTNIFGTTANYFEGFTNTVYRMEMAYQIDAPFQSASFQDRVPVRRANGALLQGSYAPLGYTTRDVWAGMLGFDRPTWIKWLNPRTTWFLTGQFFWSYVNGGHSSLRGSVLSAGEEPYFTPKDNVSLSPSLRHNGVGQWNSGPFAGQVERTQDSTFRGGTADAFRQWEVLTTLAATSFYMGGTIVPFIAIAIDPVNRNFLSQMKLDYFLTNNLITQFRLNLYSDLGSHQTSLDPWGAGGLNARRDEVGVKITYQF